MYNSTYYSQALNFLVYTSSLLDGTVKALRSLPDSQISLARQSLMRQPLRMSRDKEGRRIVINITSSTKDIPYVTNEDGILVAGLLPYVIEGIIPILKVQEIWDNLFVTNLVNTEMVSNWVAIQVLHGC